MLPDSCFIFMLYFIRLQVQSIPGGNC